MGDLQVEGGLPIAIVRRYIRRHAAQVQYCYEQGLQQSPQLSGYVVVAFGIAGDGSVTTPAISSSTLGNATVHACLLRAVGNWSFPEPEGGGAVTVHYPIALTPDVPAPRALPGAVRWTLVVVPERVSRARRGQVDLKITATNVSRAVVEPGRTALSFEVDGDAPMQLNTSFGNGGMEHEWMALPPGMTVRDERPCTELAETVGDHVIVMSLEGRELARTVLHVDP